ncbi:hypothetical protein WKI72_10360 [Candidatus Erwinia dacicola]|nr:hypothetical protein [Candidatus Erwinia dacicola]
MALTILPNLHHVLRLYRDFPGGHAFGMQRQEVVHPGNTNLM